MLRNIAISILCAGLLISTMLLYKSKDGSDQVLRVGLSPDYPPFEFVNNGQISGFEIDIVEEIAARLNMQISFYPMEFDSIIAALQSSNIDIGLSSFTRTGERESNVDFSISYYRNDLALITLKKDDSQIIGKIGVQLGSTMESFINDYNDNYNLDLNIISLSNSNQLIQELKLGHLNGVILEKNQAIYFTKMMPLLNYKVIEDSGQNISMIFKKGSDLKMQIDRIIDEMKNDGTLQHLESKWLSLSLLDQVDTNDLFGMFKLIYPGIFYSIAIALLGFIIAIHLGAMITIMRSYRIKYLNMFFNCYVSIFRGTPLLIQVFIIYYGLPDLIAIDIGKFPAIAIAFSLNSTAYVSEILKSSTDAIPNGQMDAALSLGFSKSVAMRKVILPQAFLNSIPTLLNEAVNLLKETAIISIIGIPDVIYRAKVVSAQYYTFFGPYLMAAICYYIAIVLMSLLAEMIKNRIGKKWVLQL